MYNIFNCREKVERRIAAGQPLEDVLGMMWFAGNTYDAESFEEVIER